MVTRERIRLFISGCTLLWLGLMIAPAIVAADELREVEHPAIDFLFTANGAAEDYRGVYLEPISVWYPTESKRAASSAEEIRQLATVEIENSLMARGLDLVDMPNRDSLIVRVQYIDLTATPVSSAALKWTEQFRFRVEPGHITIVAEMRDAVTGRVLIRMADLQDKDIAPDDTALAIDLALQHWSRVIAASITSLPQPVQIARVSVD